MDIIADTNIQRNDNQEMDVNQAETKPGEAQETLGFADSEATGAQIDAGTRLEHRDDLMNEEAAKCKPTEDETTEVKATDAKVENSKALPSNTAKVKATAAARSKPAGAQPEEKKWAGVRKARGTRPPPKRSGKVGVPSLDDMLAEARKWITAPSSYMLRNPDTGCFGLSVRKPDSERSEITIAHSIDCDCLDVRLMHIAMHVDSLVKGRHLARRSRDSFVIATKIRKELPHPIPNVARFATGAKRKQAIRRPRAEVEAEVAVINVVDVHRQQKLIEKWKNLEAYKVRPIWKDW